VYSSLYGGFVPSSFATNGMLSVDQVRAADLRLVPRIWMALIVNLTVGKNVDAIAVGPANVHHQRRERAGPERRVERVVEPLAAHRAGHRGEPFGIGWAIVPEPSRKNRSSRYGCVHVQFTPLTPPTLDPPYVSVVS
jgi:hypothetical protein